MDWEDVTPEALRPAIKHLQDVFEESDWKCSWITQHLCFADLHPGIVTDEELTPYRSAFVDFQKILGPALSKQFDLIVSTGTPSATFHGYAEMYRYGLNTVVRDMLLEVLQIGISNAGRLGDDPVEWAKHHVENRIRNGQHRFNTWIKNVCDVQPTPTQIPLSDEDVEEMIWWRKWRAPRFIIMRPSGNMPYNEPTAWTREDEQRTSKVLNGLSKRFTDFLEIELGQLVGHAHVQKAKRGPDLGRAQSLQDMESTDALNDRKFCRMAIDQARKSVSEGDGRTHPFVGAVVVKNGQVLSVAHRGEIAEGNHAEFVALEKKLPSHVLSEATVYTTLEPCTTRSHPKVPCAERLIERKIGLVVLGMLDPDERIRGLGQMRLRAANIATQFFPADLMAEVEELNRNFTRDRIRNSKSAK